MAPSDDRVTVSVFEAPVAGWPLAARDEIHRPTAWNVSALPREFPAVLKLHRPDYSIHIEHETFMYHSTLAYAMYIMYLFIQY